MEALSAEKGVISRWDTGYQLQTLIIENIRKIPSGDLQSGGKFVLGKGGVVSEPSSIPHLRFLKSASFPQVAERRSVPDHSHAPPSRPLFGMSTPWTD